LAVNPKKSHCNLHSTLKQRLEAVKILSVQHSLSLLCTVLNVNRSSFYKFLNHKPSQRELKNQLIKQKILELYAKTDKRLGSAKMTVCFKRDYCISVSSGRVYRLMKQMNLPKISTSHKPRQFNQHFSDENCRNLLAQQFNQHAPNTAWAADFTYVTVNGRFYCICAIMDLFAKKIIACRVSNKLDRFLAIETLRDAVSFRDVYIGILFHTDRGSQFTSSDFRKEIDRLNMIQFFPPRVILMIMLLWNVSLSILRKRN